MQTFLPYKDFYKSGKVLDNKRLGKQRVEVLQMLNKIKGITKGKGWTNHPCTKMWSKNSNALVEYGVQICLAWRERGYKDTCLEKIKFHYDKALSDDMPFWLGDEQLHISHQSKLIQKNKDYYKSLWPNTPDNLEYVWPVP